MNFKLQYKGNLGYSTSVEVEKYVAKCDQDGITPDWMGYCHYIESNPKYKKQVVVVDEMYSKMSDAWDTIFFSKNGKVDDEIMDFESEEFKEGMKNMLSEQVPEFLYQKTFFGKYQEIRLRQKLSADFVVENSSFEDDRAGVDMQVYEKRKEGNGSKSSIK